MNANRNINLIFLLQISCLIAFASCSTDEQAEMTEISLDKSTLTLVLGDTETLKATSNSNQIMWISSNTDVVTVTNGVITAVGLGDAIVNAKIGNSRAFCEISVIETPVNVTEVSITEEEVILTIGKTKKLEAIIGPEDATYKNVRWSSSNPEIVFVDDLTGEVQSKALGQATITVTTVDGGKKATSLVKVWPALNLSRPHNETSVTLDPTDSEAKTHFSWIPFEGTTDYVLKISLSEDFSSPILEKEVNGSSLDIASFGFNEAIKDIPDEVVDVYWTVEPKDPIQVVGETRVLSVTKDPNEYLRLSSESALNLTVSKGAGEYQYTVVTESGTSSINTVPLSAPINMNAVIASIKTKNSTIQSTMSIVLIKADGTEVGTVTSPPSNSTTAWKETVINAKPALTESSWGEPGDYLKMSFLGSGKIEMNAIHFRPMNYQEIKDNYVPEILKIVSSNNQMTFEAIAENHYILKTTGTDPNFRTNLSAALPNGACILTFEYKSNSQMGNNLQLFLATPTQGLSESRSLKLGTVAASPEWTTYRANLTPGITGWGWGVTGSYIRWDIGEKANYEMEIRNIKIVYEN